MDFVHPVSTVRLRCSEVDDLDVRAPFLDVNQDVLKLQVSMGYVPRVAVTDCLKYLLDDDGSLLLIGVLGLHDFIQLYSVTEFSNKV